MAGSSIPTIAIFSTSGVMVVLMVTLSGLALAMETARFRIPNLNRLLFGWLRPLLKTAEDRRVTGATYIAVSALVAFLVFEKPVAIAAIFFLSLGDPAAALVGIRAGGVRILGKSPLGTLAFFVVALAIAGVLSVSDVLPFHWGLVLGAAVAALVELFPTGLDDNLTVPLVSGAVMTWVGVGA